MTPDWLAEIEARLKAAKPGPWFNGKGEGEAGLSRVDSGNSELFPFYPENHDAEFIAHAPTDIAKLLHEVENLQLLNQSFEELSVTKSKIIEILKADLKLAIDVLEDVPEKYLTREQIESLEKLKRGEG